MTYEIAIWWYLSLGAMYCFVELMEQPEVDWGSRFTWWVFAFSIFLWPIKVVLTFFIWIGAR